MAKNIPAFPRPIGEYKLVGAGEYNKSQEGMTLRDYYAGQALIGLIARIPSDGGLDSVSISQSAFEIADQMLTVR